MGLFGCPFGSSTCSVSVLPSFSLSVTRFAMCFGYISVRARSSLTVIFFRNERTRRSPMFLAE